jgi:hypothetical protein
MLVHTYLFQSSLKLQKGSTAKNGQILFPFTVYPAKPIG